MTTVPSQKRNNSETACLPVHFEIHQCYPCAPLITPTRSIQQHNTTKVIQCHPDQEACKQQSTGNFVGEGGEKCLYHLQHSSTAPSSHLVMRSDLVWFNTLLSRDSCLPTHRVNIFCEQP